MTVAVPLEELQAALDRRSALVYLLTVGDGGRPHCVAVRVAWRDSELEVRTGATSARNAEARPSATLLAPPQPVGAGATEGAGRAETDDYSLIIDGDVTAITKAPDGGAIACVRPTHAVFHRPAHGHDGAAAHDCVPVFDHPGSGRTG